MDSPIKTKFLVLSDTHCIGNEKFNVPDVPVDVAIHCGDLTEGSRLLEFRTALDIMRQVNAPLKLIIAGNHDFTLDPPTFLRKKASGQGIFKGSPIVIDKHYGTHEAATSLLHSASSENIIFLDEGTHTFALSNGALLTVYASPYSPSRSNDKAFTYSRIEGHQFSIPSGVDVAITHSPPRGILDNDYSKKQAGCDWIYKAIAKAKPRMHCFGHIHEGWGAKLIGWREDDKDSDIPGGIDGQRSFRVESLSTLFRSKKDNQGEANAKAAKLQRLRNIGYAKTSHCAGDRHPIELGRNTLCVNAAIQPYGRGKHKQQPWVVEMELPAAKERVESKEAAAVEHVGENNQDSVEERCVDVVEEVSCLTTTVRGMDELSNTMARLSIKSAC
ncbi:Metallo-dependent phosphatase-like protein [Cercophora samala]|uniref:Metallo-dependent phosphatase-like protein n=1 Tax=Cercophora samala TaxID=330535 RepID=A0AA39ZIZ3_9PEZI|nr:Metallo-dependent phosphatase-like protein [Cercophora samala]